MLEDGCREKGEYMKKEVAARMLPATTCLEIHREQKGKDLVVHGGWWLQYKPPHQLRLINMLTGLSIAANWSNHIISGEPAWQAGPREAALRGSPLARELRLACSVFQVSWALTGGGHQG